MLNLDLQQFLKCNNGCIQPFIYLISTLPVVVLIISFTIGLIISGKIFSKLWFVLMVTGVIIIVICVYKLLEWLCVTNKTIGWVVVGFPYGLSIIGGIIGGISLFNMD